MIGDSAGNALDAVRDGVERFLSDASGTPAKVSALTKLAGGASQESWRVDVTLGGEPLRLVMRRDMGGVLTYLTLPRDLEFAVLRAAYRAGVPVPKPYFEPATIAGRPAYFCAFVEGESVGRRIVNDANLAPVRPLLTEQLAAALAAIHRVDAGDAALVPLRPHDGKSAIERDIERLYRELDSVGEGHPALELVLRRLWLERPPSERERAFLHGDFRIGNVLVGSDGLRAVLDWEFAHVGDPHEDVAWFCVRAWRFGNDALEAGGIAERETWLRAYEAASGRAIDRKRIAYLEILGNVRWAVGALMQARRHLKGEEPSIELASLGRLCAEMEHEALRLLRDWPGEQAATTSHP